MNNKLNDSDVSELKESGCTIWCNTCSSGHKALKKIFSYEDDQNIWVCPNCETDCDIEEI